MELGSRHEQTASAEAWELLQRILLGQRGRVAAIAAEFDLAPAQMWALHVLDPHEPKPMSELANRLRCDNSNVTGIVDRLEGRGLVRRSPGATDRRIKMLTVTPEGEELRERVKERLSRPPAPLAELDEEDARALRDILLRALERSGS